MIAARAIELVTARLKLKRLRFIQRLLFGSSTDVTARVASL